jgi:glyoxylase-like metal-dependent hydrolase (beta-lactamase superfamily II)
MWSRREETGTISVLFSAGRARRAGEKDTPFVLQIGSWALHAVPSGDFALDGGAMFGVVPRPLWSRTNPPDETGRISLKMRLLLIRGPDRTFLVDTGIGDKFTAKHRGIYRVENAALPDEALRRAGFDPGIVTDVILTHLHFDHAGGATRGDGTPTFPGARYHVQRSQFEWARTPTPKDRASFRPADFLPLFHDDRLELHEGETELADGIRLIPVDGHTRGMQLVRVGDGPGELLYTADLTPTHNHLRTPFVMAYDNEPLKTIEEKRTWLDRAVERGTILFYEHDPDMAACRIHKRNGDFEAGEEIDFS